MAPNTIAKVVVAVGSCFSTAGSEITMVVFAVKVYIITESSTHSIPCSAAATKTTAIKNAAVILCSVI